MVPYTHLTELQEKKQQDASNYQLLFCFFYFVYVFIAIYGVRITVGHVKYIGEHCSCYCYAPVLVLVLNSNLKKRKKKKSPTYQTLEEEKIK